MGTYQTKKLDYGYKEKIIIYDAPIITGSKIQQGNKRQRYSEMDDAKQEFSNKRRIKYYKRAINELVEIAMMNEDLNVVITLTFAEAVQSYDTALAEWQLFLKRLRHLYNIPLKYICVWEYQKKRSKHLSISNGGIFHFHCLMNIGFIEHHQLEKIWGQGYVWIEKIPNFEQRKRAIRYTTKYCVKEIVSRLENNDDTRGQRFFFTSNNLKKPSISKLAEALDLKNIIFEELDNLICDGEYYVKNELGCVVNKVSYVEYKKE